MSELRSNAGALQAELDWLQRVVDARVRLHCGEITEVVSVDDVAAPEAAPEAAHGLFVRELELGRDARLLLALALAPHLRPQALDVLLSRNAVLERPFTEFGGVVPAHIGFLPTVETALFLLAGDDLARRLEAGTLLDGGHPLFQRRHLALEPQPGLDTLGSARLVAAPYSSVTPPPAMK